MEHSARQGHDSPSTWSARQGGEQQAPLDRCIQAAREHVLSRQRADGSWQERADMGPTTTAMVLIALTSVEAISEAELSEGCRWLRSQQLPDGSFANRPFATQGDLSATALCWAALGLSKQARDGHAAAAASAFVEGHGGLGAVCELARSGDVTGALLCLSGRLAPERLQCLPLGLLLVPHLFERASRRVVFYGLTTALSCSLIVRNQARQKRALSRLPTPLLAREHERAIELLTLYQNRNGSLMNVVYHTALLIPALVAAGLSKEDPRVARAIAFLRGRGQTSEHGWFFDVYGSDVWSTACYLRALLLSGSRRTDSAVTRAATWLLAQQCRQPHPALTNPQPHAARSGGWGFQSGEDAYPDCDTTSTVLDALARALFPEQSDAVCLPAPLAARASAAIASARAWLLGMQNPDGGWPSFFWGHPSKRPGPIMLRPLRLRFDDVRLGDISGWLRKLAEASELLSDPATEDVTSRVLTALARSGSLPEAPEARRAVAFLETQQCPSGAFWGRWKVNYVPATAGVMSALATLGGDAAPDLIQRAGTWLVAHQNQDGGFGEDIASYGDPTLAGVGDSTPCTTAAALLGLTSAGRSEASERAARYLLDSQLPSGAWPNLDSVAPLVPPDLFYFYDGAARYLPLEALARHREQQKPRPSEATT